MSAPTLAQALAVALDHAEEVGEVSPELRERIADLWPRLRIVFLLRVGDRWSARTSEGTTLCHMVRHWRQDIWAATVHTAATGTGRCRHMVQSRSVEEAYDWLCQQMHELGWVLR